jgi:hypothetical protein
MITNFKYFLITEIADTTVVPDILQEKYIKNQWTYWIQVKERVYLVRITITKIAGQNEALVGNFVDDLKHDAKFYNKAKYFLKKDGYVLKIDFMLEDGDEYKATRTNDGDALLVMANIMGVVTHWFNSDELDEKTRIVALWLNSKSEEEGDARRSKMYRYYLGKTLQKLGLNIIEEKDITEEWTKRNQPENPSNDKYIFMQYKIEPITIDEVKKRISDGN